MRFNPGDSVIKLTGGNKMKVVEYTSKGIRCAWVSESYQESFFDESELVLFTEYKNLLNNYKREDVINQILK